METQTSPFLRLPPELRNRIYEYAIGDRTLAHVRMVGSGSVRARKVHLFPCQLENNDFEDAYTCSTDITPKPAHPPHYHPANHAECQVASERGESVCTPFALMRVSRQMYDDTKVLAYARTTFLLDYDPQTFRAMLLRLSPQHRRTIKAVFVYIETSDASSRMWRGRNVPHPIGTLAGLLPCLEKCDLYSILMWDYRLVRSLSGPTWELPIADNVRVVFQNKDCMNCMARRHHRIAAPLEKLCQRVVNVKEANVRTSNPVSTATSTTDPAQ